MRQWTISLQLLHSKKFVSDINNWRLRSLSLVMITQNVYHQHPDGSLIKLITLTNNLNKNICNHTHCHLFYFHQLPCGEILSADLHLFMCTNTKSTKTTLPSNMTPETNSRFCVLNCLHEKVISAEKIIYSYINPIVHPSY